MSCLSVLSCVIARQMHDISALVLKNHFVGISFDTNFTKLNYPPMTNKEIITEKNKNKITLSKLKSKISKERLKSILSKFE